MPLTLNELTTALEEGSTTSVQLTEQLARATDPAGEGARAYTRLYAESALAQARASDTLRAAGVVRSAVEGPPVSIKDLFDVKEKPPWPARWRAKASLPLSTTPWWWTG